MKATELNPQYAGSETQPAGMMATSHKQEIIEEAEWRAGQAFAAPSTTPAGVFRLIRSGSFSSPRNRFCLGMPSHKLSFSAKYLYRNHGARMRFETC